MVLNSYKFTAKSNTVVDNILLIDNARSIQQALDSIDKVSQRLNELTENEEKEIYTWIRYVLSGKIGRKDAEKIIKHLKKRKEHGDTMTSGLGMLIDKEIERGRAEGREEVRKIVRAFFANGVSIEIVTKSVPNLSQEEIQKIYNEVMDTKTLGGL